MSSLQMGKPINLARTTIVPIERVAVGNYRLAHGWWFYGSKEPLAVLVCDDGGVKVLSVQEHEFSLDELIRKVPGLESALARFVAVGDQLSGGVSYACQTNSGRFPYDNSLSVR